MSLNCEFLLAALFAAGAKDAFLTPVIMKKSRPGSLLTVLGAPDRREVLLEVLFRESTTIGVRIREVRKVMLPRRILSVSTSLER